MSEEKNNWSECVFWLGFWALIIVLPIFFAGEPDLMDGIIYRLFEGNLPEE